MNGKEFLQQVWPDQGHYCIATPAISQTGNHYYKHYVHPTWLDAYLDARSRYHGVDVYFGIFTHLNPLVLRPKWNNYGPSRKRENMDQCKTLFLDLDVGKSTKDKPKYATQAHALAALSRFLFRTGFPAPIVVSSGNGLHIYWPLENAITADQFKPAALALRLILDEHKIMYDPSRTTDTTSVLRVPGTLNHKDPADLKPVKVLFDGDGPSDNTTFLMLLTLLSGNMQPIRPQGQAAPAAGYSNITPGSNFPPTLADEVAAECEQIRTFRDSKGNISEPHWYAGIGVLAFCTDGPQSIHQWSSGYAGYTHAETQAKIDQWKANGSVASCYKLGADGVQGACARCPHAQSQYKNPIVITNKKPVATTSALLATPATPAALQPPPVPTPYVRAQGLSVGRLDPTKNVVIPIIPDYDLYPVSLSSGIVNGEKYNSGVSTWVAREHRQGVIASTMFEVSGKCLINKETLGETLVTNNLFFSPSTEVQRYMSAYLKQLQAHNGNQPQHTHIGWLGDRKLDKFILNGKVLDKAGRATPCIMAKDTGIATDAMRQGGDLIGQISALSFFNHPSYMAHRFFILCSLGNALLMATGHHGVTVHATGESAASKSTTMAAASGIWGDPTIYTINGTQRGMSSMARELRAMTLMNAPTCVDEITHMEPDDARAMIMGWTQAKLRTTLKNDRTVREHKVDGYRSAYLLTNGNSSLHQTVNTDSATAGTANSARIMQIPFDRAAMVHTKEQADAAILRLRENFGWLGEHFMSLAMPSMEHLFDSVRRLVAKLDRDTNAAPIARFLTAAAAPALVAGEFAVYHGLLDWDMDAMYEWFVNTLWPSLVIDIAEQQGYVDHRRVLREFVNSQLINTLTIDAQGNIPQVHLRDGLLVRNDLITGELWIDLPTFRTWCMKRGTPMQELVQKLTVQGGREVSVSDDVFALWTETRRDSDGPYKALFCISV